MNDKNQNLNENNFSKEKDPKEEIKKNVEDNIEIKETKEKVKPKSKIIKKKEKFPTKSYIFLAISIIFLGVSVFYHNKYIVNADKIAIKKITYTKETKDVVRTKEVQVFYPNDKLDGLVSSKVKISAEDFSSEINSIFMNIKSHSNYLMKTKGDKYLPFFDQNITILNSYLVDDKLYINLSPNIKNLIYTKEQELLILYSMINTYTSIPGVKKVKFLIDGNEVERLRWYSLKNFYTKNLKI